MEKDAFANYNPNLFPRMRALGDALIHLSFLPQTPLATHGDTLPAETSEPQQ